MDVVGMYKHVRWYFNVSRWSPSRDDWLRLTAGISEDELARINKFHYQEDSKSSLVGRALIRKFVSQAFGLPSNEIKLERTELGRPVVSRSYLADRSKATAPTSLDFNVSHSGDYCVLAGFWSRDPAEAASEKKLTIGVDVTKIVSKRSRQELDRFLHLMSKREFLPDEWETVMGVQDERQRCINFTRLWCLKESFIKSIGLGLSYKLDRICFKPGDQFRYDLDPGLLCGRMLSNTQVLIDNKLDQDWTFLETALDDQHLVAIGYNRHPPSLTDEPVFVELDVSSLMEGVMPMRLDEFSEFNWTLFSSKATKTR